MICDLKLVSFLRLCSYNFSVNLGPQFNFTESEWDLGRQKSHRQLGKNGVVFIHCVNDAEHILKMNPGIGYIVFCITISFVCVCVCVCVCVWCLEKVVEVMISFL